MEVFYKKARENGVNIKVCAQSKKINWLSLVGEIFGDEVHMRGRARVHPDLSR